MIHVCSLARLHETVEATGAQHVVTLLKHTDRVERPRSVAPANHLILGMDDITVPTDGYTIPCDEHVTALIHLLAEIRAQMSPAVSEEPPPLHAEALYDPRYSTQLHQFSGGTLLEFRHPSLGWIDFVLPCLGDGNAQ